MSLVAVGSGSEHPHPDSARLAPTHPAELTHPLSTAKSQFIFSGTLLIVAVALSTVARRYSD